MKQQLIAFVTAGAIATTGMSAPVQAGQADELARILMGAVIIGAIAQHANGNTRVTVSRGTHYNHNHRGHRHHVTPPRHNRAAHAPRKPLACKIRKHTRNGWVTRYRAKCMQRMGWHRHNGLGWHPRNRH